MNGPDHYREAERLTQRAGTWANADAGWKAHLTSGERIAHRMADLAEAQVHATLANAAATALNDHDPNDGGMPGRDHKEWIRVAGTSEN